ncbi:CBS domain-containing protein [Haliangium ochraceum]|uniref:Putative signal transduction protein with CBS domains n=1 Tax=Haliangium ochraceum (strain DSM 14365 / JCM 11303 / SMP-2) TaxID=502025 RepID=D0LUJ3_HALO1|nr:CBS domain-containing protein [Haliangium ochraceum]ACY19316.1 putative signal transduction protein with CBS domains [Haliangium ochraceum DSM 14365]
MRVQEIMTADPTVLKPEDTLARADEEMMLGDIRHLPVVDRQGLLLGILSHRDVLAAGDGLDLPVSEYMAEDLVTVGPEVAAHEAAYLILRYAIGSVPVVDDDGHLVGIVTQTDFVRAAYGLLGGKVPVDQIELEEREADRV